ncbi:MAG TPA: hypothetical protein VMD02_03420 [Candidatus Omnitrophota bacterium]|nr:hypothetical protein [Candidatus Omnitrophota bacterium]
MIYLITSGEEGSRNRRTASAKFFKEPGTLSDQARGKAFRDAVFLKKKGARIGQLWHAPELNAKQTADIYAREFGTGEVYKKTFLRPEGSVEKCLAKLEGAGDVAIVADRSLVVKISEALKSAAPNDIMMI